ncbi:hypothetical protein ES702_06819 [subsurface metagenome]
MSRRVDRCARLPEEVGMYSDSGLTGWYVRIEFVAENRMIRSIEWILLSKCRNSDDHWHGRGR